MEERGVARVHDGCCVKDDWTSWLSFPEHWLPVFYAAAGLIAAGLLAWLWSWALGRLHGRVRGWKGTRIRALKFQRVVLLGEDRIVALLGGVLVLLRWAGIVWIFAWWLVLALHLFPATQELEQRAFDYVADPLVDAAMGIVRYIPKLLFIAFAVLVVRLLLKGLRFFFRQIELGNVRFRDFHPDWAGPTYQLAKMLVIVFLVIVIFPYLPASSSGAFKGISVFLGVLVSLGSSSAVGNIVSGVVLTYMRPYKVGDYVRVASGAEGTVVERSLLLTRLQTPQNELVTIPNAQILSGQMVNYSGLAQADGVILHMPVTLNYGLPQDRTEALLLEAVRRTDGLEAVPPPYVMHVGFDNAAARWELNAHTRQPKRLPFLYSDLRRNVQAVFAEAGVDMTTPVFLERHGARTGPVPKA